MANVGMSEVSWKGAKVDPRAAASKQAAPKVSAPQLIALGQKYTGVWNKTKSDGDWIKAMNYLTDAYEAADDDALIKQINDMRKKLKQERELDLLISK